MSTKSPEIISDHETGRLFKSFDSLGHRITFGVIANCLVLQPCMPSFQMALWHDTTFAGRTGRTRVWSTPTPTWNWPFGTCPTRTSTSSAISGAPSLDRYRKNRWSDLRDSSNNWNQVRSPMHFIFMRFGLNVLKPFFHSLAHRGQLTNLSALVTWPDWNQRLRKGFKLRYLVC